MVTCSGCDTDDPTYKLRHPDGGYCANCGAWVPFYDETNGVAPDEPTIGEQGNAGRYDGA